jgi:hypothetical protein
MVFTSERVERPRRGRLRDCTARARQRSDPANADGPIPDLDRIFPCVCEECSAAACGSSPPSRKDLSGLLSQRHCRWLVFRALGHSSSIFLEPFAPPALTGFHATMAPLTPARWSRTAHRGGRACRPLPGRSLCFTCLAFRAFRPQTPVRPCRRFGTQPFSSTGFHGASCRVSPLGLVPQSVWASPLASRLANRTGRNGFVILRTARSPPVALHLLSRGRSYVQLQAGVCMPEKDSHPSDQTRLQTQ